jgi:uncharacterized protein YcbX
MLKLNSQAEGRVPLAAREGLMQSRGVTGHIASIYRHPVKGFTPERLDTVSLAPDTPFPCDRLYAVEDGPSGFDPEHPAHISKIRFTVLAKIAQVAAARTAYDEATGVLTAGAVGHPDFAGRLTDDEGKQAFAAWLADLLGPAAEGPLSVIEGPGGHRFTDHPLGQVSIVNLASVRDLGARIGHTLDPLRFRANLYVDGWPAWAENDWVGRMLKLGEVEVKVFKPIVRCAAIGVDPASAQRDLDLVKALFDQLGHVWCGVYVQVAAAGRLAVGDRAEVKV